MSNILITRKENCIKCGSVFQAKALFNDKEKFEEMCVTCVARDRLRNDQERAKIASTKRRMDMLKLTPRQQGHTFDNYNIREQQPSKCCSIVRNFLADFKNGNKDNLVLYGTTGTGKTHLGTALAKSVVNDTNSIVLFREFTALMQEIKTAWAERASTHYLMKSLKECDLLVFDEVGTNKNPHIWDKNIFFEIINHRYEHYLPTVLLMNDDIDAWAEREDPRVVDRILENVKLAAFNFQSYRRRSER